MNGLNIRRLRVSSVDKGAFANLANLGLQLFCQSGTQWLSGHQASFADTHALMLASEISEVDTDNSVGALHAQRSAESHAFPRRKQVLPTELQRVPLRKL